MDYNLNARPGFLPANLEQQDIDNIFDAIDMAVSECGHAEDALSLLATGERIALIVQNPDRYTDFAKQVARWEDRG